jgi:hypothetical protein
MKNKIITAAIFCGILFSACATAANKFEKGEPKLEISSLPNNANIIFYDKTGNKLLENLTPAHIKVPVGCSYIEISKDGYFPEKVFIGKRTVKPWYFINFIPFAAGAGMAGLSYGNVNAYGRDVDYWQRELDYWGHEVDYWNKRQGERYFSQKEIKRKAEAQSRKAEVQSRQDGAQSRKIVSNLMFYGGITIGVGGLIGIVADPLFGNVLSGRTPINVSLKMTPEKEAEIRMEAEAARQKAAEAEAERQRAAEEKRLAEAAAKELNQNPKNLDRTQYRKMDVSDFSFNMAAGRLPVGSKINFSAQFLGRPTGITYLFRNIDIGITMTSDNNFARHLSRAHFESYVDGHTIVNQRSVSVFVTVQRTGQFGLCSVDIIDW